MYLEFRVLLIECICFTLIMWRVRRFFRIVGELASAGYIEAGEFEVGGFWHGE